MWHTLQQGGPRSSSPEAAADATESVRDLSGLGSVRNALDDGIESGTVRERGIVVLDSLTELGTPKRRFMLHPRFAHASHWNGDGFPHDRSRATPPPEDVWRPHEFDGERGLVRAAPPGGGAAPDAGSMTPSKSQ